MKKVVIAFIGCLAVSFPIAAWAASPDFSDGVKSYQARRYNEALSKFGSAEQKSPTDATIHYYMGLCYQGMNQMGLARQEYAFVASRATGALQRQAQYGLSNLSRYQSGSAVASTASASGASKSNTAGAPEAKFKGRLKIYEFTTSWCHFCKEFEPSWESVSRRMSSKADFKQLDAEDPSNANLVSKWGVSGYPSFIYTDDTGKALKMFGGAYQSETDFVSDINSFYR